MTRRGRMRGAPGQFVVDLAFNPHELRGPDGRWISSSPEFEAVSAAYRETLTPGLKTQALIDTGDYPAKLEKAGWVQLPNHSWASKQHGHSVTFPPGGPPDVEAYFAYKVAASIDVCRKAYPAIDKKAVKVKVHTPESWDAKMASTGGPPEGVAVGYVNAVDDPDLIHINPMIMVHNAKTIGKQLPAAAGISLAQATLVHEIGHVVGNRTEGSVIAAQKDFFRLHRGQLSDYANTNPQEAYAEAWTEWVLGNAKNRKDDPAFEAAKSYAEKYGWGWTG